ncbi:5-(carboxyamino)imidazole ribonucleotide synthase [Fructilactobacillus cliffordii]|uniref:5-(carboxyamino)imidazole ribonucleotide synthase n=1 Tax=Fructilactobacillus cliffordii TaxID=2940299 RepID=UPI002091EB91|nr:5-(carboxyamino)imidazole ribonucleotide synthase [Fructilactobacillus cliffordii]USS86239.1 5-(carboxyamino)imidazole ribonucleotide synthase [Fructilactobacillus cliffordii]
MTKSVTLPPATLGIIGGGQLGRMMAEAAKPLGYRVVVVDPQPDAPAGQVADQQLVAAYDDRAALAQLAQQCDVLTYEFENVDAETLAEVSTPAQLPQGVEILNITSDRLLEKQFIEWQGIPVTDFQAVDHLDDLAAAVAKLGTPAILKTRHGGYDGHGQWNVPNPAAVEQLLQTVDPKVGPFLLEKQLMFSEEVSMMVTRAADGQITTWPLAHNVHQDHILKVTQVNADDDPRLTEAAEAAAAKIAAGLQLRGVLGVEMFVVDHQIVVNELAPRPHNSGHYTIEGCNISQFEGHVRSIMGLPIEKPRLIEPEATMINLLGDQLTQAQQSLPDYPEWHFHDYQKDQIKPHRKMAHITVLGHANQQRLLEWEQTHHENN